MFVVYLKYDLKYTFLEMYIGANWCLALFEFSFSLPISLTLSHTVSLSVSASFPLYLSLYFFSSLCLCLSLCTSIPLYLSLFSSLFFSLTLPFYLEVYLHTIFFSLFSFSLSLPLSHTLSFQTPTPCLNFFFSHCNAYLHFISILTLSSLLFNLAVTSSVSAYATDSEFYIWLFQATIQSNNIRWFIKPTYFWNRVKSYLVYTCIV